MEIDKNGFWLTTDLEGAAFDYKLAVALADYIKEGTAIDLGCGCGLYTRYLRDNGIDCVGFDGNPNTPAITEGLCQVLDLSREVYLGRMFDYVISLEVGEHIPRMYEEVFINNLHKLNRKGIILSWAVEGQGGAGHVNERSNAYIRGLLEGLGYTSQLEVEQKLREAAEFWWFKETIMVFNR